MNAFDVLKERGYFEWCTNEERLSQVMAEEMITAYVGFDPTADSLHVGHLIPLMALGWLQKPEEAQDSSETPAAKARNATSSLLRLSCTTSRA